jgi:hypothetical protein
MRIDSNSQGRYASDVAYPVIDVARDAALSDEQMGTKRKFWLSRPDGRHHLFKFARVNNGIPTGEDWAEKVASEIGRLLGVEIAEAELARCGGARGILVARFGQSFREEAGQRRYQPDCMTLVHGNELLLERYQDYPTGEKYRVPQHTVERVIEILDRRNAVAAVPGDDAPGTAPAADAFVGYLLLDAWIGNTDRHHENWGILECPGPPVSLKLAPSYDHASALGRNVLEAEFNERLTTRDRNRTVEAYAIGHARSALYARPEDRRPLSPIGAFEEAARLKPLAASFWLARLRAVESQTVRDIIDQVPGAHMSVAAREFVTRMLEITRGRLLAGAGGVQ